MGMSVKRIIVRWLSTTMVRSVSSFATLHDWVGEYMPKRRLVVTSCIKSGLCREESILK
jgi:hypothetical protein